MRRYAVPSISSSSITSWSLYGIHHHHYRGLSLSSRPCRDSLMSGIINTLFTRFTLHIERFMTYDHDQEPLILILTKDVFNLEYSRYLLPREEKRRDYDSFWFLKLITIKPINPQYFIEMLIDRRGNTTNCKVPTMVHCASRAPLIGPFES